MRSLTRIAIVLCLALFFARPWFWMALVSFKGRSAIFRLPKGLLEDLTFSNYYTSLVEKTFYHDLWNGLFLGVLSSTLAIGIAIPAAYAISRKVRHGEKYYTIILSTRFLPAISVVLPLFVLFSIVGLQGSFVGILLVHSSISVSLAVVLLRAYFDRVPGWLDEAARLDGANTLQILFSHIVPAARQGLSTAWFLTFLVSWNEFLFASILTSASNRTIPVVIPGLVTPHGTYWGQVAALGVVASAPGILIAIWLATRRRTASGA